MARHLRGNGLLGRGSRILQGRKAFVEAASGGFLSFGLGLSLRRKIEAHRRSDQLGGGIALGRAILWRSNWQYKSKPTLAIWLLC